ncbi:hypothetical protein [Deinococcus ruber]|nr:hypothetical protein [Deinococcus ruber]
MRRIVICLTTIMTLTVSLAHADPTGGNGGGLGYRALVTAPLTV